VRLGGEGCEPEGRALDAWQRYILSLMAMYEPENSRLFDRAWAHAERLAGKRRG
jgi:hypothetical protein